ncbi:hypothetical protein ncot_00075 [Nocardioides sp. JQ2195]|uniref:sunset domain-containing protein n=1 Tax=Nocardioides sp. JQ2195 TaxID=2592334 RepID=UPI00143ED831|nr:hypothetical protein [Nocardioides sp. JQ2195]QIX25157.1 hypothetical protein ncot_00075 [Nocardioides sp. JQ2195]
MRMRRKNTLIDSAAEVAEGIRPALESARDKALPLLQEARDKAGPMLADAREKAEPYLADAATRAAEAREKAAPYIAEARDKAVERASDAREKAAPYIAEARDKAAERATEAREKVAPLLAEGKALATEKALAGREATVAKVNELRGIEPEPKKGGKLKKFLFVGALAGIGGLVYKKLNSGPTGDNWQSTYVPAPAPSHKASAGADSAGAKAERADDDKAAATPGEAIADSVETPHADTTPDNPAEIVNLRPDTTTAGSAEAPYGAGSAAPLANGDAPDASYTVKGNGSSMLFHTDESPSFAQTKAEVWFTDSAAAEAAGFRAWNSNK